MSIAVFGVNHRTAPLEVRERFAHAGREVPGSLERVLAAGARGGVLLSTCNRTEFYLTEPGDTVPEIVWTLLAERLVEGRGAREFGYAHRDRDAVRHLYRVSSGLDSMLLGESQIQGQVREAWEISKGQAGPVLHRLFQSALLVGARVRSETGLGMGAASAPSAAVALAGKIFNRLAGRSALILGAGDMAELAATCLAAEGVRVTLVANRSYERAQAIAEAQGGAERRTEIPAAERIVSEEVERFWAWYGGLAVVPVLKEVRDRLEQMRAAELERALRRLAHLSAEDREQIEHLSHALLNKFLH